MKVHVILNPKSKRGNDELTESIIKEKFNSSLVYFSITSYAGHATEIAKSINPNEIDTVVVVGGDGTVNEVINGIAKKRISLGIIPTGTANDLATYCNLPLDVEKACDVILNQDLHRIDLIDVNGKYYVTGGGIGLPTKVAKIANKIKCHCKIGRYFAKFLGSNLYVLALLCSLTRKYFYKNSVKVVNNGSLRSIDTVFLTINNQPYIGKNFLLSPYASNKDGIMDVCCAKDSNNIFKILVMLFKTLSGNHFTSSLIESYKTKELIVMSEKPISFLCDGETNLEETTYKIKIAPNALNVLGLCPQN